MFFSIGSAYFVTGSYPDGALVAGDNDFWDDFHPPEDEFSAANPLMIGEDISDFPGFDPPSDSSGTVLGRPVGTAGVSKAYYGKVPVATSDARENSLNLNLLENDQLHHY